MMIEDLKYETVPQSWKKLVVKKKQKRNLQKIEIPLLNALMNGYTTFIPIPPTLDNPQAILRAYYGLFYARGKKLSVYQIDDVDRGIHGYLAWAQ